MDIIEQVGGCCSKPTKGADTRWGGFIPMVGWVNKMKTALMEYEAPDDCVPNDDGSVFRNHALEEHEWLETMQLVSCMTLNTLSILYHWSHLILYCRRQP